ncbi:hypothetical protein OHD62_17205 [Mesorhizobium sp. YC-39]|uniref:hypothetical protein n=1 Tax=unclassified Mesorhizobium TaxID=325217 RepID=UPI0021E79CF5|nr:MULTISPECIES: hypothetical protein [unclassified Mesorhizobium]MCV3209581.1 hypothetical protein [Mesorhizobium sp. YC-2]MCV3230111.1 hypothetical protein [Mesorhizobium sp. YC-39]
MTDRLKVRFAYQRGWQVVDENAVLQTFETKEAAFQFLVDRGARVWLDWSRTVIGGRTARYDFAASFQTESVGRIMKTTDGPSAGTWFWSCYSGGARGTVDTKDEAVFGLERAYTRIVVKADYPK